MNKQQLEEALNNAPEGATHYDFHNHYWHNSSAGYWLVCDDGSRDCEGMIGNHIRKLSDLQAQLDQLNEIERLKSAIVDSRWTRTEGEKHYCNFCHRNLNHSDHEGGCVIKELNK